VTSTAPRKPHAEVSWIQPKHNDNSLGVDPLAELTVISNFKSPYAFKVGSHKVIYTVRDSANLEAGCFFLVKVEGKATLAAFKRGILSASF
jgi:hypothetical protein